MKKLTIALAGNPNVGKSTVFNALTGARQHVGNWPGKTVEKKEGGFKYKGYNINAVDLPGTYSLTAYSIEEIIARNFVVDEHTDVVVHIVDSSNLERNLYLTVQLVEMGANIVVALNMIDVAEKRGMEISEERISHFLGVPAVKIQANKKKGIERLKEEILAASERKAKKKSLVRYGKELEEHIEKIYSFVKNNISLPEKYNPKWIAIKLLENDREVIEMVKKLKGSDSVLEETEKNRKHLEDVFGEDVDTAVAEARYGFIAGLVKESVDKKSFEKVLTSDKIDKVVTNRALGIPIFLIMMFIVFQLIFEIAVPLADMIDVFFSEILSGFVSGALEAASTPIWLVSLIVDGVIAGVGSVLVFVPFIFMLFLIIAILEDSGYMARAAFVMDRVMHKIGLHGKSFIPMILGFGCNVPAVMATRVLESRKDRILTILINPFMSCGARLPVYVLFAAAFFPANGNLIVFSLYILGIIIAIIMGFILKSIFFKGLSSPFVMELPPYRLPTIRGALIHMWERGWLFIKKAGTVIFAVVILIWFLASVPIGVEYGSEQSAVGMIGKAVSPVFAPLGFGNWQSSVALTFGFVAKEVVVGTFGVLYGVGDVESEAGGAGLIAGLQGTFTSLSAYAFLVFVLLYVPCMAVVATIKREIGWKWALFTVVYTTAVAWVVAFIVYQGGLLLGFV